MLDFFFNFSPTRFLVVSVCKCWMFFGVDLKMSCGPFPIIASGNCFCPLTGTVYNIRPWPFVFSSPYPLCYPLVSPLLSLLSLCFPLSCHLSPSSSFSLSFVALSLQYTLYLPSSFSLSSVTLSLQHTFHLPPLSLLFCRLNCPPSLPPPPCPLFCHFISSILSPSPSSFPSLLSP